MNSKTAFPLPLWFKCTHFILFSITEKFGSDSRHHLELLRTLQNRDGVPLLFGHLYENYAHLVIPRGGDFETRNLSTGESTTLHLEPKEKKLLRQVEDLSNISAGEYGWAHNSFPAVDAVMSDPPTLFNMTTNLKHGLDKTTLKKVLNNLPEETFPRPCHYNWVMPSNKFDNFGKQSISGTSVMELDTMVEQFAMELSISEPIQQHSSSQGTKRKMQDVEETHEACDVILKSGPRKGQKCGRLNCSFHTNTKIEKKLKK